MRGGPRSIAGAGGGARSNEQRASPLPRQADVLEVCATCVPEIRSRPRLASTRGALMRQALLLFVSVLCLSLLLESLLPSTAAQFQKEPPQKIPEPPTASELREQVALIEKVLPQLPDRGAAVYILSTLKQRLGETSEALKLLRECLALHEGFDPAGSPSFKKMKGTRDFDKLVENVHRDFPAVQRARLAFVINEIDLVPEGLAYDRRRKVFYLSSLNRRKIVKIADNGKVSDIVPTGRDNLLPVLGIRVDPGDGTIWAASWSEDQGKSELLHFDTSGELLGRFAPHDAVSHGFNDLAVQKNGEIIVTDSVSNQIYRFDPRGMAFVPLAVHRRLSAPNGITLADDDRQLFVADDFGVVRIGLVQSVSMDLSCGPGCTLSGVDGLYWHHGSLVAIQNGIGSPRITVFRLSTDGMHVEQTTVLENRTEFTVAPTTGAIRGNNFYFIANSQGDNLNVDQIVDPTKLARVRIGVLRLP